MKKLLFALLLAATVSKTALGVSFKEVTELAKPFSDQGVVGTFVLFDVASDTVFVWNEKRARERFVPASTFKIANSLIGLNVGAVKN
jgi:beta-lactamase class D